MRLAVLDIGDKADTAVVVFVPWVVQALCFRQSNRRGPISLAHRFSKPFFIKRPV
jgi:hypothetical protein